MAAPEFLVGRSRLPTQLRFEKLVCQNEGIWTLRGKARTGSAPPLIRQ